MNMESLETHRYKGHAIALYPDNNAIDPRKDDNLGHMICWHRRYTLGDKHPFDSPEQFEECLRVVEESRGDVQLATIDLEELQETPRRKTDVERFIDQLDPAGAGKVVVLPLYLYDHSGITMSTTSFHDRWDSCQVGYIYAERAEILAEYGGHRLTPALRQQVEKQLRGEVDSYDHYLRGAIVGYQITARNGKDLDGCWGFEDPAHALAEAKAVIDHLVSQTRRRRAPARHRVPTIPLRAPMTQTVRHAHSHPL